MSPVTGTSRASRSAFKMKSYYPCKKMLSTEILMGLMLYFFLEGPFLGNLGRPGFLRGVRDLRSFCQAGFCLLSIPRGIVFSSQKGARPLFLTIAHSWGQSPIYFIPILFTVVGFLR